MVYSIDNFRFLKDELVRLSERYEELSQNMAELKRRAGMDPDERFPAPAEPAPAPSARTASTQSSEPDSLFGGRFNF